MLDLETMGNGTKSVVVAIGAVYFDPEDGLMGDQFYMSVSDWHEQVRRGCIMDASTVRWWLGGEETSPNQGARDALFVNQVPTVQALAAFHSYMEVNGSRNDVKVWGNGVDFDNVILRHLFTAFDMPCPWKYPNSRCFRTLKNEFPVDRPGFAGDKHNALSDAINQAEWACKIYKALIG